MSTVVSAQGITKRFRDVTALDQISFSLAENKIHGLLGRNGAGKTTLMQIMTGQGFATSGNMTIFGQSPYENETVMARVCFIKESQTYPQHFKVRHALESARLLFPDWDEEFAQALLADFRLPLGRHIRKLSRGMHSMLGIIIGLASRAPLTLFDEPYLGLDAVARHLFYDHLLTDYAEHPRTVVLSTHLIDEVGELIEHVLLLDQGRVLLDTTAEALRGQVVTVAGPATAVDEFAANNEELHRERLGRYARATLRGTFGPSERAQAKGLGLDIEAVSLQDIVIRLTTSQAKTGGTTSGSAASTPKETVR
ncbi:ABC transporter ATP-binding protein [Plantactinospora sp. S1510]|uniref:ABC transporter ATP-binding protein n=1 Tax=Plantactinospora alkalitolerans TaxID=2789879 RepID=A0ABS0GT74_9ACTN|nr:ABC transporter ATP-binding protein [Plantactinospora alkalitolerans]MBF9129395.1 ABC transporter ATP-binding protein [Plantactinospora alkalitolerans]